MGHRVVRQRALRVGAVVAVAALAAGCTAGRANFRRAESLAINHQWDEAVEYYQQGGAGGARPAGDQDCARAGDAIGGVGARPAGPRLRGPGPDGRGAARVPPGQRVRSVEPVDRRARRRTRPRAARAARGDAAAPGDRADARAGAAQLPGADPQPVVARSAQPALRQHQPARSAQLHRQRHRHQRHLRPRLPGPQRHRAARGRHARAGPAAGDALEPDLLQGAERADDHRRHRQHRQAAAVRGAGHQDVLRVARRRHRAGAAGQHRDPGAADGHPAAHRRQQDRQHDHRAGLDAGGRDHRAGHQDQRQAARRGGDRRPDPRGQPRARQTLRPEPDRLRHWRDLLARAVARRQHRGRPRDAGPQHRYRHRAVERQLGDDLQRQHDLDRDQRRRLLPGRAGGDRPLPRERLADQDRGQAAAARPGGDQGHAQPRRRSAGAEHHLHADCRRRRLGEPAHVVHLPADRRHRRDDAARHLRGRHRDGPHGGEQRPRPGLGHRRADPAGLRVAQGARRGCGCATASRTCWPACCARTSGGR